MNKIKIAVLCVVNTMLLATGQMLFKYGVNNKKISGVTDIWNVLFSPTIILAILIYIGTTCLWLYILSYSSISFAYPIQALAFPFVLIASSIFFHEHIPFVRWIGIFIIMFGVIIATRS